MRPQMLPKRNKNATKNTGRTKINMGPKKNLNIDQQRNIINNMPYETGLSGYDPIAGMIVPGIGIGKLINWWNSIPATIPPRMQNFYDNRNNPMLIPDSEVPTFRDIIQIGKTKGFRQMWKDKEDIVRSGIL